MENHNNAEPESGKVQWGQGFVSDDSLLSI